MSPGLSSHVAPPVSAASLVRSSWPRLKFAAVLLGALAVQGGVSGCVLPSGSPSSALKLREPEARVIAVESLPVGATVNRVRTLLGDPAALERDGNGAESWTFPAGRAPWPELAEATLRVRHQDGRVRSVEMLDPRR